LCLFRGITREDSSLYSSTISNSLVRIDALVGLFSIEKVRYKFDDTGNASRAANKDNLMHLTLVDLGVMKDLFNWFESTTEEVLAKLLETGTSERGIEINTLIERVDLNRSLGSGREGTLGPLASGTETTNGTRVTRQIYNIAEYYIKLSRSSKSLDDSRTLLVLALELLAEVVDESVVKVLTTEMGITSSSLDLEDTFFNGQKRNIKSASTKIKDKDVAFAGDLFVKAICNSSGSRLIDDT